ncbi:biliverdin-producing heme oxygenase [Oceanicola sp. 22II-s10i]|uniref:biliverdin-producing heme oxygenase n=1 Tax=Oceanicola sp. 22II-s10i TaxID=1317116 RepID=UPI0011314D31|nr:biliverdin-producing heme oxygenase [Oceanicola sp. 22II-s10i]
MTDPKGHMAAFLSTHLTAFSALARVSLGGLPSGTDEALAAAVSALRTDCAAWGIPATDNMIAPRGLDPLAVAYVVLGSGLGTEVIRRKLLAGGIDPLPSYFTNRSGGDWRDLCARLDAIDPESERAIRIVMDTDCCFDIFIRASAISATSTGGFV